MIRVGAGLGFAAFRRAARPLLERGVRPEQVLWQAEQGQQALFGEPPPVAAGNGPPLRIAASYARLAEHAAYHRDEARLDVLYRVAYRLTHREPHLLELATDPDVLRLRELSQEVSRDLYKMHAFVRFRKTVVAGAEHFVAWHRPDHPLLELGAPFFRERFASMRWTILTPDASCTWDLKALRFAGGAPRHDAPNHDELEELFIDYYRAIFNPARLNLRAMQTEMPAKHWRTLPETRVIGDLLRGSTERVREMLAETASAASAYLPEERTLPLLREAAAGCQACELHAPATQTVFGEGPARAALMLVGEQPGDEEDLRGLPFIGPAGQVLERALAAAGIDRRDVYVTNAVKHFKFESKSERRLHKRPRPGEVRACRAWLDAEIAAIQPRVVVCLGSTAAQSFSGSLFNLTRYRGRLFSSPRAKSWLATWHPSLILRTPEAAASEQRFEELVADLRAAREVAEHPNG
ncbi:MAG TPA: UdgX family uracil-DNA binding protein [Polyangiaceae bacterium]|nr:UdgX family uracil-DNA binding protein [Polyangiaceae bacterium]